MSRPTPWGNVCGPVSTHILTGTNSSVNNRPLRTIVLEVVYLEKNWKWPPHKSWPLGWKGLPQIAGWTLSPPDDRYRWLPSPTKSGKRDNFRWPYQPRPRWQPHIYPWRNQIYPHVWESMTYHSIHNHLLS